MWKLWPSNWLKYFGVEFQTFLQKKDAPEMDLHFTHTQEQMKSCVDNFKRVLKTSMLNYNK